MRELKPLSGLGPDDRSTFWEHWQRLSVERRIEIVRAMVELTEDNVDLDFQSVLTWSLEDQSADVRQLAIEGLWESENSSHRRRLLELLRNEPAPGVRAAAATGLSRFAYLAEIGELEDESGTLLRGLLQAINDQQQPLDVRRRALEAAGFFAQEDEVRRQIERAYAADEQLSKESALVAMGRSMLPDWLPIIRRELGSSSPALRYEAARAAGELAEEARPLAVQLAPLAADDDGEIAAAAIWALGQIGGPAAKRALQQLSKSQDEARSQAAADALAELTLEDGLLGREGPQRRG